MSTALLVIDVQMGMFDEEDPVFQGDVLLEILQGLISHARKADVPVIYVQHNDSQFVAGERDWEIHPSIAPQDGELIIQKHTPDSFNETDLGDELGEMGITKLIITGIQTEYCVDTTSRRAFSLGYDVTLVEEGHSTWDNRHLSAEQVIAHHNSTLDGWAVAVKPAAEIQF